MIHKVELRQLRRTSSIGHQAKARPPRSPAEQTFRKQRFDRDVFTDVRRKAPVRLF